MSYEALAVIFLALAVGSLGKAIAGFGLPLIAIPVMAPYLGVENAVVVMVIPATMTNAWLGWEHRAETAAVANLWPALAVGLAGIVAGTWLLSELDDRILALIMACWIAVYLASLLFKGAIRIPLAQRRFLTPIVVLLGGLSQGATGIAGPIVVTYLHALKLAPRAHVFAVSAIFLSYGLCQMVAMSGFGMFTEERLIQSLIALVPVAAMTWIGIRIGRVISRRVFDACVVVLLIAMGARLAWKGFTGV